MARLRNRIMKATFWTDPELLRWPRDKRTTYKGLWALAEDSGCLEDDPFEWKLILWPSPMDADITVELLEQWRDELVEYGKLLPYESDGKPYLYAANFHQHEKPRNPQSPDLPLPPWVQYESKEVERRDGRKNIVNTYSVRTDTVPNPYEPGTVSPVLSCPVQSLKKGAAKPAAPLKDSDYVGHAVDIAAELKMTLDKSTKGRIGKAAKEQAAAGADPAIIVDAIRLLLKQNKTPAVLGALVRDVQIARANGRKEDDDPLAGILGVQKPDWWVDS